MNINIGGLYTHRTHRFLFTMEDMLDDKIGMGDVFVLLKVIKEDIDFIRCRILTTNGIVGLVDLFPQDLEEVIAE